MRVHVIVRSQSQKLIAARSIAINMLDGLRRLGKFLHLFLQQVQYYLKCGEKTIEKQLIVNCFHAPSLKKIQTGSWLMGRLWQSHF